MSATPTAIIGDPASEASIIRPGDTLILRYSRAITSEQAADIKALVEKRLPGIDVVVLSGIDEMAVYRPTEGTS